LWTIYDLSCGGTLNVESPFKTYLNFRNNHYLIKKNIKPLRANFLIPFRFCLDFLAIIKFLADGKFRNAAAVSKAHRHVIKAFYNNTVKYNRDISKTPNLVGMYNKSIVIDYFLLGNKKFKNLRNH
jgi:hypothetical protein